MSEWLCREDPLQNSVLWFEWERPRDAAEARDTEALGQRDRSIRVINGGQNIYPGREAAWYGRSPSRTGTWPRRRALDMSRSHLNALIARFKLSRV